MRKSEITLNSEWDETGIPPIGTVCEYRSEGSKWRKCEVVAYYFANVVAVDVLRSTAVLMHPLMFRPIKTPDQIAAEERQQAIDEMLGVLSAQGRPLSGYMGILLGTLYDAGYRKTEVKK